MAERTFEPGDTVKNRNVNVYLVRRGPNPGEWVVKQFSDGPGAWRHKVQPKETIMTEIRLLEMVADAAVRNMACVSDAASVSPKPVRKRMSDVLRAQFRLADHRAKLMRATN